MGDIADMMLDGTLDEETGEYIGDHNLEKYGTVSPGFPVSIEREAREKNREKENNIHKNDMKRKTRCPICNKKIKVTGLSMHVKDVHKDITNV